MVKKALMASVALLLSGTALAAPGVYVQGDLGYSKVRVSSGGESVSENGFSPRLSVGYDFDNNWRAAVDYTHYKTAKATYVEGETTEKYKSKLSSVGLAAIYDFPTSAPVKPYAGVRLGLNRVASDYSEKSPAVTKEESYRKTKAGLGVLAGIGYNVTENVVLDAGYRYNYWGKFEDEKVSSHEISAGVRVKF
ncbi:opacity family porin [Neisseria weaveri]|uniref:opacity family porin n=1 Tax=Neisseria weaveri TaxID=28091 RepID=UPI000D2FE273|nr:opacity family porin [Neisseria weaveri]